jgi:tRNA dimethylallyltransferase
MTQTQHQLISILGTTATGKTKLALFLANKILQEKLAKGVTLISADSRQVYQGLEILTGADIPPNFNFKQTTKQNYRFAQHQTLPITLHGVSIIQPNEEWSVAHFRSMAINLIQQSWQENQLPIVVGGTSFYHKQLFNNDPDIYIKPNPEIRKELEKLSTKELQQKLKTLDPNKITQMNTSDSNNPRRLIRAIEVAQAKNHLSSTIKNRPIFHQPDKYFSMALQIDLKTLQEKITLRVEQRFDQGAVKEVKNLLLLSLPPSSPAMTTLGVEPISQYLQLKINKKQAIENWTLSEFQYAKRQITWLKQLPVDLKLDSQPEKFWSQIRQNLL